MIVLRALSESVADNHGLLWVLGFLPDGSSVVADDRGPQLLL